MTYFIFSAITDKKLITKKYPHPHSKAEISPILCDNWETVRGRIYMLAFFNNRKWQISCCLVS